MRSSFFAGAILCDCIPGSRLGTAGDAVLDAFRKTERHRQFIAAAERSLGRIQSLRRPLFAFEATGCEIAAWQLADRVERPWIWESAKEIM
jgi:hypothetical protein